jgi:hypothetical protein
VAAGLRTLLQQAQAMALAERDRADAIEARAALVLPEPKLPGVLDATGDAAKRPQDGPGRAEPAARVVSPPDRPGRRPGSRHAKKCKVPGAPDRAGAFGFIAYKITCFRHEPGVLCVWKHPTRVGERSMAQRGVGFAGVLLLAVLLAGSTSVHAQEATPSAETGVPEGITFEAADLGTVEEFPAGPATVTLFRLRVEPGAGLTFPPEPGLGLHVVESGALTIGNFSADVAVTRAAPAGSSEPGTREILPAGEETTLGPGDSFVFPPVAGGWRNDGPDAVVFTVVLIDPVGGAAPVPEAAATPAA